MNTDPIADMLTRIRNAEQAQHAITRMPYSKIKHAVLNVLKSNGFIVDVEVNESGQFKELNVTLREKPEHRLSLKRISKPGQRIYVKANEVPTVLNGLGISILSTPKGVMCNRDAKKQNLGGELLCEVY